MFEPRKWTIRQGTAEQTDSLRPTQLRSYGTQSQDKHGRLKPPKCDICKIFMRIIRRQAHPTRGARYELQTFKCPTCGQGHDATVASLGGS